MSDKIRWAEGIDEQLVGCEFCEGHLHDIRRERSDIARELKKIIDEESQCLRHIALKRLSKIINELEVKT